MPEPGERARSVRAVRRRGSRAGGRLGARGRGRREPARSHAVRGPCRGENGGRAGRVPRTAGAGERHLVQRVGVEHGQRRRQRGHGLGGRPQPAPQQRDGHAQRPRGQRTEHQRPAGDPQMPPTHQRESDRGDRQEDSTEDQQHVLHAGRLDLRPRGDGPGVRGHRPRRSGSRPRGGGRPQRVDQPLAASQQDGTAGVELPQLGIQDAQLLGRGRKVRHASECGPRPVDGHERGYSARTQREVETRRHRGAGPGSGRPPDGAPSTGPHGQHVRRGLLYFE